MELEVIPRSNRAEVRNPMVGDPALMAEWETLREKHPEAVPYVIGMMKRLRRKWQGDAARALKKHKPPMYAYHKANAVNADALGQGRRTGAPACW